MPKRYRALSSALVPIFIFVFFGCGLSAQTLQIINVDGHATALTAAQMAKLPHTTVNAREHDSDAQFSGVPLAELLSRAGIELGDGLRGPRMTEVLLVTAADNYKVAFALAECDPA